MATRYSRYGRGPRPRRRWVRAILTLAILGCLLWFAPLFAVQTPLRDLPLGMAFAGINGRLSSGGASWHWLGRIEYRDVVLSDPKGRAVLVVPRLVVDKGLVSLAAAWLARGPVDLGTVRLIGGEALVEVRHGGSVIEDIIAPWLATAGQSTTTATCDLEIVDGAVELVDLEHDDSWRITELLAAATIHPVAGTHGWTAAGRVRHGGRPSEAVVVPPADREVTEPMRFDRTTITAGATAALARDGGWSVSSPARGAADAPRALAVATNRLPLGVSSVAATRFAGTHVLDGLADVRLDITLPIAGEGLHVVGTVSGSKLAICNADTLAEVAAMERCEVPMDVVVRGDLVTIRDLRAISPLFKAEASGRLRIPNAGSWEWAESLVGEDFAIAADIDLAAAARAIPGGLTVRPDVRVTDGKVQLAATARPDGRDRVLELRVTSRDLAAVQHAADGERPLRWNEPFTAWLRGRRGPARSDRLRIEEARIASPAVEVSAAGTAESSTIQWTVDMDKLMKEAAEVLDFGSVSLAGSARGTLELSRVATTGASAAKLTAALTDFEFAMPGRRTWTDKEITIKADGAGSAAGAAWLVDEAHAEITAADDRFQCTLKGGAIIDPQAIVHGLTGMGAGAIDRPWVRTAPDADALSADCSVAGDLARWQARLEALAGAGLRTDAGLLELGGTVQASAAVTARGDAWQITRANAEMEKLSIDVAGRGMPINEPRLVASAAGLITPAKGLVDVSSAEVLTATFSLRTGGATIGPPARPRPAPGLAGMLDRVRGKVQWQADVGRLEKWLVAPLTAARWPAGGRAWGTAEVLDTPDGVNLLVEMTGNQLTLASVPAAAALGVGGAATPQPVWAEPRAAMIVEVTRPHPTDPAANERLTINRLGIESSTLAVAASGRVDELSSRRMVEVGGTLSYDWDQLTRLLTPWTGGRLRIAGGGARPFAIRGPLGSATQVAVESPRLPGGQGPLPATGPGGSGGELVPLPDDWLAAARGTDATARATRIAMPVQPPARPTSLVDRLRDISIDSSTTWTAADLDGFRIEPGEMGVRLFEGQLAFGPFDIGASGGRLRGAPWVKLLPLPGELIVPPGRMVDRVALSREMCDRWVTWVAPLLGRSTQTQGLVSVDVGGGRIPLGDPFGGEMSGQVIFENLEVTPGEHTRPLVNLIVRLQSAIDPRFAFGDKTVLLRVRPDPVRVRLAERRLWHEGLIMDTGQLTMRTSGSVGADGTLSMVAELAFRGDIAGQTPVIAQLLRTPLAIPLRGTVNNPQFDAGAIDTILGRIVSNTAEAVINDGLSRGLEALFGNPQPPNAPPGK